jgi:hypothetical protein
MSGISIEKWGQVNPVANWDRWGVHFKLWSSQWVHTFWKIGTCQRYHLEQGQFVECNWKVTSVSRQLFNSLTTIRGKVKLYNSKQGKGKCIHIKLSKGPRWHLKIKARTQADIKLDRYVPVILVYSSQRLYCTNDTCWRKQLKIRDRPKRLTTSG